MGTGRLTCGLHADHPASVQLKPKREDLTTTRSCTRQPSCLRKRRKRGNPHDAGSTRGLQDPHNRPAAGPDGRPGGPRPDARRPAGSSRTGPGARPPGAAARSSSWSTASPCTRPARSTAAGGRSGTRTASGSSARRPARRSWPPSWRRSPRLQAGAPDMMRPGADLITHYLDPDRLPVDERWSRKHAHTQRRLASGSPPRSSARSPARTSQPSTCRRSSTPPPRQGKAPGSRG